MPSNPPARIPTPDPQCSCDLHEPCTLPLPPPPDWQQPPEIPTMRYRRMPEIAPSTDEEPTEPGTPPPPLAASCREATPTWDPVVGEWLL